MIKPYIGITGFTNTGLIAKVIHNTQIQKWDNCSFMVGVLASHKTLKGNLPKKEYRNRYPNIDAIQYLFLPSSMNTLNLIHYNTKTQKGLSEELSKVSSLGGPYCNGLQLNICWPDVSELKKFKQHHPKSKLVLQISRSSFKKIKYSANSLIGKLLEYEDLVDYILLDSSGGKGIEIDIQSTNSYLEHIYESLLQDKIGIGIAGGLSADTLPKISQLLNRYPGLSIDAEGKLLNPLTGTLEIDSCLDYLRVAGTIMGNL